MHAEAGARCFVYEENEHTSFTTLGDAFISFSSSHLHVSHPEFVYSGVASPSSEAFHALRSLNVKFRL